VYNHGKFLWKWEHVMLIQVIYHENKRCGAVHKSRLDFLVRSGLLFAFRRADGWVIVGKDPVRGESQSYIGADRRKGPLSDNSDSTIKIEDEYVRTVTRGQDLLMKEENFFLKNICK